jgi:glycosyltransferase involved in cell wall biosynthesis
MASLYSECNCYVKISGVNSGLSFIEAFASGLVCVGPESGGCREILNRDIGFMINKRCEKRISNNTLFNGITYNVYDDEHLSEVMLWIFNNFSKLKEKTVKERKIVLSKFDCNVVSQTFLKSLG